MQQMADDRIDDDPKHDRRDHKSGYPPARGLTRRLLSS
jgi:hypothetical protein